MSRAVKSLADWLVSQDRSALLSSAKGHESSEEGEAV